MKIKSLVLLLSLICFSACTPSLEDQISLKEKNELSEKRHTWAQFEEKRTQNELSSWQ
jgi:hypothetical protein